HSHHDYRAACRDLRVSYCTIDIERSDWMTQVQSRDCAAFLVWPTAYLSVWKQLYDERLATLRQLTGRLIHPELEAMLIYESKRRMHYWLATAGVSHPRTWIVYNRAAAMAFADRAELPLVVKTDLGAEATGVRIIRNERDLRQTVRMAFGRGILRRGADRRDREWGTVLLQQYIPHAAEWRIIRIGQSY